MGIFKVLLSLVKKLSIKALGCILGFIATLFIVVTTSITMLVVAFLSKLAKCLSTEE